MTITKIGIFTLLLLTLGGCVTTRDFAQHHPVATGIGVAFVMGSIAAAANGGKPHDNAPTALVVQPGVPCYPQPNGTCR